MTPGLGSATPAPSASAARLTGDDLQHLIGWYWALSSIRPEKDIRSVAFEGSGAGNLDDIVVTYSVAAPDYWQVKGTVAAGHAVDSEWLMARSKAGGPSMLQKFHATWVSLRAKTALVRLVLATNRPLDSSDAVLACRDANSKLGDRLRRATSGSDAGVGRREWASHLGVTEEELCEFLDHLEIETDASETSWAERVADVAMGLGLKFDNASILAGVGQVRRWIRTSRVELTPADVEAAIDALNLRRSEASGVLLIQAINHTTAEDATVSLDWVDRFAGDSPTTRRGLLVPQDWNSILLPDLQRAAREIRTLYRSVIVCGDMRLPIWFAAGVALLETAGFSVSTSRHGQIWGSSATRPAVMPAVELSEEIVAGDGPDFAVAVAISYDLMPDVLEYAQRVSAIGTCVGVTLPGGPNARAILAGARDRRGSGNT